jgi:hypothetical protein
MALGWLWVAFDRLSLESRNGFLILELNRPLDGFIKVSKAPLRNALEHLDR